MEYVKLQVKQVILKYKQRLDKHSEIDPPEQAICNIVVIAFAFLQLFLSAFNVPGSFHKPLGSYVTWRYNGSKAAMRSWGVGFPVLYLFEPSFFFFFQNPAYIPAGRLP